jgi:4-diphosphocytidyl-2-C-methyl-D-erythritol kinase
MRPAPRQARVRAFAKINLALKVLNRRADGYHELRTVFQTVSLADTLDIDFTAGPRTSIEVRGAPEIPDNLIERAARLALEAMRITGRVRFGLTKRIPVGAGLGGGSSDAAAVLLALPVLAGKNVLLEELIELAAELGSDVPFFLLGGRAVALGRGTELYPLPERRSGPALLVAPELHISTAEAYRALGRELTSGPPQSMISSFQSCIWQEIEGPPERLGENDFEALVLERHPGLKSLRRKLEKLGASPAMLSGSGSALFGVFDSRQALERARRSFQKEKVFPISLVSRARYRGMWWRRLQAHTTGKLWPPQSRYAP